MNLKKNKQVRWEFSRNRWIGSDIESKLLCVIESCGAWYIEVYKVGEMEEGYIEFFACQIFPTLQEAFYYFENFCYFEKSNLKKLWSLEEL